MNVLSVLGLNFSIYLWRCVKGRYLAFMWIWDSPYYPLLYIYVPLYLQWPSIVLRGRYSFPKRNI